MKTLSALEQIARGSNMAKAVALQEFADMLDTTGERNAEAAMMARATAATYMAQHDSESGAHREGEE